MYIRLCVCQFIEVASYITDQPASSELDWPSVADDLADSYENIVAAVAGTAASAAAAADHSSESANYRGKSSSYIMKPLFLYCCMCMCARGKFHASVMCASMRKRLILHIRSTHAHTHSCTYRHVSISISV